MTNDCFAVISKPN